MFYGKYRDYSHPSEAAKLRILGATRLHCEETYSYDDEEKSSHLVESPLGRGESEGESACEQFNRALRDGVETLRR